MRWWTRKKLQGGNSDTRKQAVQTLLTTGSREEQFEDAAQILNMPDLAFDAIQWLAANGSGEAVEILCRWIPKNYDYVHLSYAYDALRRLDKARLKQVLTSFFMSDAVCDASTRAMSNATHYWKEIAKDQVFDMLSGVVRRVNNSDVCLDLVKMLKYADAKKTVPILIEILEKFRDSTTRQEIIMMFKWNPDSRAVESLAKIMQDPKVTPELRYTAAAVLQTAYSDSRATPELVDQLRKGQLPSYAPAGAGATPTGPIDLGLTCRTCGGKGRIVYASHWQKCPDCQGPSTYREHS